MYDATVEEVYSGDDLVLLVNLGVDGLFKRVRARLKGVDTPSAFKAAKDTEAGSVRELIRSLVAKGRCVIELHSYGKGGWLVTLYIVPKEGPRLNVNEMMVAKGYIYHGKPADQPS
jgi:endonuclease YncB( thermonuclease family)